MVAAILWNGRVEDGGDPPSERAGVAFDSEDSGRKSRNNQKPGRFDLWRFAILPFAILDPEGFPNLKAIFRSEHAGARNAAPA